MNSTPYALIICGDAFAYIERERPQFILTDCPHSLLAQVSKLVERHRLAWVNASSPRWLVGSDTGEKIVLPYQYLLANIPELEVCDPFMGWGAIGVATLGSGKRFVGIDNVRDRCQHSYDRLCAAFPEARIKREGF